MVVYTVLIGKYDKLLPALFSNEVKYICFSDQPINIKGWEHRHIEKQFGDNRRDSRYPKIRPDLFLHDYTTSLYHDANFQLVVNPTIICKKHLAETNVALFSHPERNCLYSEAAVCKSMKLDTPAKFESQVEKYNTNGMPNNWGLFHAAVILRHHLEPEVIKFSKLWWDEYISNSCRDQISLPYTLWKTGIKYKTIDKAPYHCSYFLNSQHGAGN